MSNKHFSPFFLILWKNDGKYSCIHRQNLVDGNLRKECDAKLLGKENIEVSFNRRVYEGKLLCAGSTQKDVTSQMERMETERSNAENEEEQRETQDRQVNTKAKRRKALNKILDIDKTLRIINEEVAEPNVSELMDIGEESTNKDFSGELQKSSSNSGFSKDAAPSKLERKLRRAKREIENLEQRLEEERSCVSKYKEKVKTLRKKLKKFQKDKTAMTDIGNGVHLNAALLERAKLFSPSPAILARNIFRLAFKESEVYGKSLTGKSCNANKGRDPKPVVDCDKRDAVINYCLSSLEMDAKSNGLVFERSLVRAKIVKSLGEFIREVTSKGGSWEDQTGCAEDV